MTGTLPLEAKETIEQFPALLEKAATARAGLLDSSHTSALRLFNGFTEGCPSLAVDVYGSTVLFHDYSEAPELGEGLLRTAQEFIRNRFPWLHAGIAKRRNSRSAEERRGSLLFGSDLDRKVQEHGAWYAIDLRMNRDASLYLDTRNLRQWAIRNLGGRTVLNAFAYTGSLGVAALAGGASRVVQLDRTRKFLDIAQASCSLNGYEVPEQDYLVGDFWVQVSRLKRVGQVFDCVFLDPPFFSTSSRGVVDLNRESARLINKVRPLVDHGGWLVVVNNALFLSGKEYMKTLEDLCADGYLKIAELISVPEDITGYPSTRIGTPIVDPAPFNHPTKIAVLAVTRKQA